MRAHAPKLSTTRNFAHKIIRKEEFNFTEEMKSFTVVIPLVKWNGQAIILAIRNGVLLIDLGLNRFVFLPNRVRLRQVSVALLLCTTLFFAQAVLVNEPRPAYHNTTVAQEEPEEAPVPFKEVEFPKEETKGDFRKAFILEKQKLIFEYTTQNGVSRLDQLSDRALLELNHKISNLFQEKVLRKADAPLHVWTYFTDTTDLHKLETSLMEQAKFHVPASIKLAQSALETGYGKRVIRNNYFGIKDKSRSSSKITTTEYYNEREFKRNRAHIIRYSKVRRNGRQMYKCTVRDHFKNYQTPWQSFRDHSLYLSKNKRYAPLFTGGKKFEAWAEKIGSSKDGGVGYATSPVYGEQLKSIIRRYHLDLLDH